MLLSFYIPFVRVSTTIPNRAASITHALDQTWIPYRNSFPADPI